MMGRLVIGTQTQSFSRLGDVSFEIPHLAEFDTEFTVCLLVLWIEMQQGPISFNGLIPIKRFS
jgi:hypothetical protein